MMELPGGPQALQFRELVRGQRIEAGPGLFGPLTGALAVLDPERDG